MKFADASEFVSELSLACRNNGIPEFVFSKNQTKRLAEFPWSESKISYISFKWRIRGKSFVEVEYLIEDFADFNTANFQQVVLNAHSRNFLICHNRGAMTHLKKNFLF